jgi:hypothetical protein
MRDDNGEVDLRLSADEVSGLLALAEPRNRSVADFVHELLAERLDIERKRSMPMAAIDHLEGQWPEKSPDSETAFHDAMWPDDWRTDHLGTILRGAAYLDALLIQILQRHLARADLLNLDRKRFLEKAKIACAIGAIDADLLNSIKLVARIRNEFAHNIGRQLTHQEVGQLCGSLKGRVKELFLCYTGGGSKSPQRLRHALTVMKIALEEIAYPDTPRKYKWFDANLAALRLKAARPNTSSTNMGT